MTLHAETLPPEQQEVLRELGPHVGQFNFYLAGGTALAIYLGHRQSLDLDWFTAERIDDPLKLAGQMQERCPSLKTRSVERGNLLGDVRGVRVSFLEYRHRLLVPATAAAEFHCPMASLEDLAAMKLLAVDQRGTRKDFLDIHALCTHGWKLEDMLRLFRQKFAVDDVARVLYSLCYFTDADQDPMPVMHQTVSWEQVKSDIRQWVKALARRPS